MKKQEEITIEFETITPIWTGDAWGSNSELKATAIMGSLRFWFEVYCHFAGIEVKEKEELDYKEFIKQRKKIENIDKSDDAILSDMKVTLASKIFGCTGWKSRIEIEKISFEEDKQYQYPTGKIQFPSLKYNKNGKDITPSWYFSKGFYGNGTITFKTTQEIKQNILLPLLNFIEQYAFIGAKNNIGYGRVRFKNIEKVNVFGFSQVGLENSSIDDLVQSKKLITNSSSTNNDLSQLIKQLLEQKANLRKKITNQQDRHYKFGTVKKANWEKIEVPQATKIIPLISKNSDNSYIGKFLSIVGIQNFGAKK